VDRIIPLLLVAIIFGFSGCTQVWIAPTGLDSNSGTESSPKKSFTGACASPTDSQGRLVHVKAGTYPPQTVPSSCNNTMFAAEGTVVVKNNGGDNLGSATIQNNGTRIGMRGINCDSSFAKRQCLGQSGTISFQKAYVCCVTDEKGTLTGSQPGSEFIDVTWRDVRQVGADVHNECIYSQTPNIRIIRNTFQRCATMDILFTAGTWWGQPPYGNGTVVGNKFYHPTHPNGWHYYGVYWHDDAFVNLEGWDFRNNWFETRQPGAPGSNDISTGGNPWVSGTRCGNTETAGNNVLDAVWKQPC
jgi:hypothetical protein